MDKQTLAEKQQKLLEQAANGCEKSRNDLILSFLKLAERASNYNKTNDPDEAKSIAYFWLVKIIDVAIRIHKENKMDNLKAYVLRGLIVQMSNFQTRESKYTNLQISTDKDGNEVEHEVKDNAVFEDKHYKNFVKEKTLTMMDLLDDRDYFVFENYYFKNGEKSQRFEEMSEMCGLKKSLIRQIRISALKKIRNL